MPMPSVSAVSERSGGRIRELDGLRGVAILTVVVYHYVGALRLVALPGTAAWYGLRLVSIGWTGVDLFFVLSGFLIGGILLDAKGSPRYFSTFYIRRLCRIVPLYALLLVLVAASNVFALEHAKQLRPLVGQSSVPWYAYLTFTQNVFMATQGKFGAISLAPTWSLAIEEQFYLILPLLIYVLPRRTVPWLLALTILGAPLIRLTLYWKAYTWGAYFLLPSRADALACGVLAAWSLRQPRIVEHLFAYRLRFLMLLGVLGTGMFALALGGYGNYLAFPMFTAGYTYIALFYVIVILTAVSWQGSLLSRILTNRVLCECGAIAYAVYLLHEGISWLFMTQAPGLPLGMVSRTAMAALVTYLLAKLSWRFIEGPILELGRRADYGTSMEAESGLTATA